MKIITKHLQKNKYTRSGIKLNRLKGLVIHWTHSATENFSRDFNWLYQFLNVNRPANKKYASYHYAIDQDGTVYELIPPTECAWHAGPSNQTDPTIEKQLGGKPNWSTLGISFLHPDPSGKPTKETYESLIKLGAHLIQKHNISINNIFRHYDCVGKGCPRYYVNNKEEWDRLKKDIEQEIQNQKIKDATGLEGFTR